MRFGEMTDLITCDAIFNGTMQPRKKPKVYTFDEAIALR